MQKGIKYLRHKPAYYLNLFIPALLTIVFLFDIGGYYLLFTVRQKEARNEIRREIRNGLPDEALTLFVVSQNDPSGILWIEPGKEFKSNGDLYDVVRIKKENQKTYYYCIRDNKEKQLIANYTKTHTSKKEARKRIKEFKFQYIPQKTTLSCLAYPVDFLINETDVLYKSNIIDIHSPPPKMH